MTEYLALFLGVGFFLLSFWKKGKDLEYKSSWIASHVWFAAVAIIEALK